MKLEKAGWLVAAGLATLIFATGFQDTSTKVGVIDTNKALKDSDLVRRQQEEFAGKREARSGLLEFLNVYRVASVAQTKRFRELSMKATLTPVEKTELDGLKKDIQASDSQYRDLMQKTSPSAQDVSSLKDFNERIGATSGSLTKWAKEFDDELNALQDSFVKDRREKLKKAISDVGQKKGYTIIFSADVVTYSANDVTSDTLKALNAAK